MNKMYGWKSLLRATSGLFLLLALSTPAPAHSPIPLPGPQHVLIDKSTQTLRAYEGTTLVFQSRISTGRWDRSTPNGTYLAGEKSRIHYSRLYHHAPMPYSVQVTGNVFIHGFTYVPTWPDSHGCIRLPLDGRNPARRFYEWVQPGTPIEITGHWQGQKFTFYSF